LQFDEVNAVGVMPQAEKVLAGKWNANPAVLSETLRVDQASCYGGSVRYDKYRNKIHRLTLPSRSGKSSWEHDGLLRPESKMVGARLGAWLT